MTATGRRLIEVKVQPRARRREVVPGAGQGPLTIRVTAAPERGQANEEVRELLAEHFGVPLSKVRIVRGERARRKLVALDP